MVEIRIFGGVEEIGGNQILITEGEEALLFDFGSRISFNNKFFSDFLNVRPASALKDMIVLGCLPKIPGIYRKDLLVPLGLSGTGDKNTRILGPDSPLLNISDLETYEEYEDRTGMPSVLGVFVTHAHLDHIGAIGFLHQDIPLYCTEKTKILMETIDEVSSSNFRTEAITSKLRIIQKAKRGYFPGALSKKKASEKTRTHRSCSILQDGEIADRFKHFKVTLIEVDHSVPGAASYLIETDDEKILYTGDIRFHGRHPIELDEYVDKIGDDVDILLCEGTRIMSDKTIKEDDVVEKIRDIISGTEGLVFVDFNWKDTTRYETIREACEKCGRTLVINPKLAYLLHRLGSYPSDNPNVKVFLRRKTSGLYSPSDYTREKYEYGLSMEWKGGSIDDTHYREGIVAEEIKADLGKYVLMLSYYDLKEMPDLADGDGKIPHSWYIKAQCEPFNDEMELDEQRLIYWLDRFGIGYDEKDPELPEGCSNSDCPKLKKHLDRAHVSGHASRPELKELIAAVAPGKLIPIHTEHPGEFENIVEEIEKESGVSIELVMPESGKGYQV